MRCSPTRSGLALLVVLESLGPSERLAFVLHDLLAVPFDEIGQILGKFHRHQDARQQRPQEGADD